MLRRKKPHLMAEINITPFTDVVLVLLIIFMIATPFIYQSSMMVELPQASMPEEKAQDIVISISAEGDIFLDDEKVDLDALQQRVTSMVENAPDLSVIVNGDKNVRYNAVIQVMDVLKQAGVSNPGLGIELRR
jgi:biopolymer transport protein ExbD